MAMEEMMKLPSGTYGSNRVHQQPSLAMNKNSHVISKFKPKIRIVHIFAPEVIKTDVASFRELVQRLTGKPTSSDRNDGKVCNKRKQKAAAAVARTSSSSGAEASSKEYSNNNKLYFCNNNKQQNPKMITTDSSSDGIQSSGNYYSYNDGIKEEDEEVIWGGDHHQNSSSAFFNGGTGHAGFNDFEGLIQGLGDFPLLPAFNSTHHLEMFHDQPENYLT